MGAGIWVAGVSVGFDASERRAMVEWLTSPWVQLIVGIAVFTVIGVVAWQLLRKWRDSIDEDSSTASGMLTDMRELHRQGVLSDQEYRTLKTVLAEELQHELNDSKSKG